MKKNMQQAPKDEAASVDAVDADKKSDNRSESQQRENTLQQKLEDKESVSNAQSKESGEQASADVPEEGNAASAKESLLQKRIEELECTNAAINDKYLRLMAEFENYKRRVSKEYQVMTEIANEQLIVELIRVRENFERALQPNNTGDCAKFFDGIKLIFSLFDEILQRNGLNAFGVQGERFDPKLHDALMKTPSESIAEDHIVEVFERGYKLKDKIIKHAKVIVSSGKPVEAQKNGKTGATQSNKDADKEVNEAVEVIETENAKGKEENTAVKKEEI